MVLHVGRLTMGVVGTVAFVVDLFTQAADNSKNSEAAKELICSAETLFAQNREFSSCTFSLC